MPCCSSWQCWLRLCDCQRVAAGALVALLWIKVVLLIALLPGVQAALRLASSMFDQQGLPSADPDLVVG
jgi:hypothetical protein